MILPLKMLDFFIDELAHMELNLNTDLSTSLLVYSNTPMNFLEFNDFSSLCDDYLELANLTSDFQIVVFQPKFYFKDSKPNNPTNSVGQSPYPTLHILRNAEVEIAINNYPNIHLVSERNSKKILSMQS